MLDATLIVNSDNGVEPYYTCGETEQDIIEDLLTQLLAKKKVYQSGK